MEDNINNSEKSNLYKTKDYVRRANRNYYHNKLKFDNEYKTKAYENHKKFIENNPVNEQILVIAGMPVYDKLQFDEFGAYFKQRDIKHILYPVSDYIEWLTLRHHTPNEFGYFDELAHKDWAGNLIKPLTRII